jgi:hypothetical protein
MSTQQNYPSTDPSLFLDFTYRQRLDPRITFTRTSSAAYTNSTGFIVTAGANTARFDYNPTILSCRGLFMEQQRTNYITYSENFALNFPLTNTSIAANATISPNGFLNASKLIEDGNLATHYATIQPLNSTSSNGVYIYSIFAQAAERNTIVISCGNSTGNGSWYTTATFNLTSGIATSGNVSGTANANTYSIQPYPNNWYRCSVTSANADGGPLQTIVYLSNNSTNLIYQGTGTSGVYIWGQQMETTPSATSQYQGAPIPTSYIFTSGSQSTRAGDIASISGNALFSFYNTSQGTLLLSCVVSNNIGFQNYSYPILFGFQGSNPSIDVIAIGTTIGGLITSQGFGSAIFAGGSTIFNYEPSQSIYNSGKAALSYILNGISVIVANGNVPSANSIPALPTIVSLGIFPAGHYQQIPCGWVQRVEYFPVPSTNTQVISLTGAY